MNLRRLQAIAWKEALHIWRDPRSLGLAIGIPMLMIVLFGFALTLDVDRVPLVIWDQSGTPLSREFASRFTGSRYFEFQGNLASERELIEAIDRRTALAAVVIPPDFADRLGARAITPAQVVLDGSDSNTAAIVLGYVQAITAEFNLGIVLEQQLQRGPRPPGPLFELRPRVWFNADLESKNFIIPGLIAVILGLIAALLTSLTVAREWERGTMEQLIATPVTAAELILGKLLPYWVIGLFDVLVAVVMAVHLFEVPLRGSQLLLFGMAGVFLVGTLAQGILISTLTRQQLLASQLAMVSTFLPAFLLSGFMFAIENMPAPVQVLTYLVPARYFVALVKGIYLRGVGLETLWGDALFLVVFALVVTAAAVQAFRKRIL